MGKKLEDIIKEIGIDKNHFDNICDQFTNKKLFKLDNKKKPLKDKDGNLIPLYEIE